jgi:thiol-disulfide isomerase/thioredoxin
MFRDDFTDGRDRRARVGLLGSGPLRHALWAATVLLLIAAFAVPTPASAQDFRLPGLRGGQLTQSDLSQGATVVVVWASWSPKCRDIVDRVNAISQRWGRRARVVTVNFQEDRDTVQGFLASQNLSVPVYLDLDGAFSKKSSVTTLPGLLVVRDGTTAYRGRLPDDPSQVLSELLE